MTALSDGDEPAGFNDGDLAWFVSTELPNNAQLRMEGVQLIKAASVPDMDAWQMYLMVAYPFAAALNTGDALLLLGPHEQFLALGDDGSLTCSAADGRCMSLWS